MFRKIKIQNATFEPITFNEDDKEKSFTIPALGFVEMSYEQYFELAKTYDLARYGVKVQFPNTEVKKVSVKDFGAKGDGYSNDTEAIQRAIDYVINYGGGIVEIPIGVYLVDGLIVEGDVFLNGESKENSILKLRDEATSALVIFISAKGGMSRLHLIGNGS